MSVLFIGGWTTADKDIFGQYEEKFLHLLDFYFIADCMNPRYLMFCLINLIYLLLLMQNMTKPFKPSGGVSVCKRQEAKAS